MHVGTTATSELAGIQSQSRTSMIFQCFQLQLLGTEHTSQVSHNPWQADQELRNQTFIPVRADVPGIKDVRAKQQKSFSCWH